METNLIGTLTFLQLMGIEPNYSELSRIFKKDRHTIKNMYAGKEAKIRQKKPSELDEYKDEIIEILSNPGVRIKSAYWYFRNEKNIKCSYDNFKTYVKKNKLLEEARTGVPHPLFETDPGQQVQVDWVENIKLETVTGEILEFNLFSATLGYSRLHYFEYTEFKTEADFKRCLIHFFKKIGGTTKEVLTDNMSAIVSIEGNEKTIHPSIVHFFKDIDVKLRLCKVRSPQTKGKNETANKYANWLQSYNKKLKDKNELLRIIEKLNQDINKSVNTRTNLPPILLFNKEKEYFGPLPNNELLGSYEDVMRSCKVPSTFLIDYKGAKYSVPPNLINKTVKYKEENGKLFIFYNNDLVAEFTLKNSSKINYVLDHYKEGMKTKFKDSEELDKYSEEYLAKFNDFGGK